MSDGGGTGKEEEEKETDQSPRSLWSEFGGETSMHGLGRAVGGRLLVRRFLWSVVVLAAAGYAIRNVILIFQAYASYPVSTTVSEEYDAKLTFPAVTICNANPIRRSRTPEKIEEFLDHNEQAQFEDIEFFMSEIDHTMKEDIAHQLGDMLVSCRFDGILCNQYDFVETYHNKYGNCYSFNEIEDIKRFSTLPGVSNGLIMELNIQQEEYLPTTTFAGMKIMIHPQKYLGFPDEEGLMVAPGFLTSIALKKVKTLRSPSPYGVCIVQDEANNDPKLNMYYHVDTIYSHKVCKKTCYQIEVVKTCQCCDIVYPCDHTELLKITNIPENKRDRDGSIFHCNDTWHKDGSSAGCMIDVQKKYLEGLLPCLEECKEPCEETSFIKTISFSRWPSKGYFNTVLNLVPQLPPSYDHSFNSSVGEEIKKDFIDNNLLRVEIFYEQFSYEKIQTVPAYDWSRLLSDLGGQLGLWLGFSVLTALEWVELVLDVFLLCCRSLAGRHGRTTPVRPLT